MVRPAVQSVLLVSMKKSGLFSVTEPICTGELRRGLNRITRCVGLLVPCLRRKKWTALGRYATGPTPGPGVTVAVGVGAIVEVAVGVAPVVEVAVGVAAVVEVAV